MTRQIVLIADDYGLSPGVSAAILDLIEIGRLSGTSCMTGFPEWEAASRNLKPLLDRTAAGLHLTLTDQVALAGASSLAPEGRLPGLGSLCLPLWRSRIDRRDIHAELDAQHRRFIEAMDREPAFIDGHQHVHFLPVVRDWLRTRFDGNASKPALRGSPDRFAGSNLLNMKIATIATLAAGFDRTMQQAGFRILRPLAGIYDWRRIDGFAPVLRGALKTLPEGGLFMCHPGQIDETLRQRDPMQAAREIEHAYLASEEFGAALAEAGVAIRAGVS